MLEMLNWTFFISTQIASHLDTYGGRYKLTRFFKLKTRALLSFINSNHSKLSSVTSICVGPFACFSISQAFLAGACRKSQKYHMH